MGRKVRVWLDGAFYCQPIDRTPGDTATRCTERLATDRAREFALSHYLEPTQRRLENQPSREAIEELLASLYVAKQDQERLIKRHHSSTSSDDMKLRESAVVALGYIEQSIGCIAKYLVEHLAGKGISGCPGYAYSPREGGGGGRHSPGADHFIVDQNFQIGRFQRTAGDPLCKSKRHFWALEPSLDDRVVTCKSCIDRMVKLCEPTSKRGVST